MKEKTESDIREFMMSQNLDSCELNEIVPVMEIDTFLESFGYEMRDLDHDNINGFDVDFWYYWDKEDCPSICYHGSLWYSNCKLEIEEE